MAGNVSCRDGPPSSGKTNQVISKLHEQTGSNNNTGNVRGEEARVSHHLKNRRLVVPLESGLVIGVTAITERVIHIDQSVAVHRPFRVDQGNAAGEVFRDFGSRI